MERAFFPHIKARGDRSDGTIICQTGQVVFVTDNSWILLRAIAWVNARVMCSGHIDVGTCIWCE